ncbi:hypothetical protein PTKIN_Ptkin17bG0144100 [Pterospermum kingtungense]
MDRKESTNRRRNNSDENENENENDDRSFMTTLISGSASEKVKAGLALGGLALAGLALTVGAAVRATSSEDSSERKTMKAPGRGDRIYRDDFEKDPKKYFRNFHKKG